MILHVGHVEVQHHQIWFEDMQMVAVLKVLEQRAVGDHASADDFDSGGPVMAAQPFLEPPSKRLPVGHSHPERKRIPQQKNADCPKRLWNGHVGRPKAERIRVDDRTAIAGSERMVDRPAAYAEPEIGSSSDRKGTRS